MASCEIHWIRVETKVQFEKDHGKRVFTDNHDGGFAGHKVQLTIKIAIETVPSNDE